MPERLTSHTLRAIAVDASLGKAIDPEQVARMADVLETVLEEAAYNVEQCDDIDDLKGMIESAEKARLEAEEGRQEEAKEHEETLEKIRTEHAEALALVADTADGWKKRAELAEHKLAELDRAKAALQADLVAAAAEAIVAPATVVPAPDYIPTRRERAKAKAKGLVKA